MRWRTPAASTRREISPPAAGTATRLPGQVVYGGLDLGPVTTFYLTVDLKDNSVEIHNNFAEPFKVTLVETGLDTMTAGRLRRVLPYTKGEPFMLTYGDGVSNVPINELLEFHRANGRWSRCAPYALACPAGRFWWR